jgi:hypothetical protein
VVPLVTVPEVNSLRVRLEACDTVVMMDVPTWPALWGIVSHQLGHGAGKQVVLLTSRAHIRRWLQQVTVRAYYVR